MFVKKYLNWTMLLCLCWCLVLPYKAQAGLLSGLAKLGKLSKVDAPDLPSGFRFADELKHFPGRDVAEMSYSHSHGQWLAKTPDGQSVSIATFANNSTSGKKPPVLLVSEFNLPTSLKAFDALPNHVEVHIKARHGQLFSFRRNAQPAVLQYQNVKASIYDGEQLRTALAHFQRPVYMAKVHMVQLAKPVSHASTSIQSFDVPALLGSIKKHRGETFVLSAKMDNGMIQFGEQKLSLANLERVAAERDVTLLVLNTEKPHQTLQSVVKEWGGLRKQHHTGVMQTGDFYQLFSSKAAGASPTIRINANGQLRTVLSFDYGHQKIPEAEASGAALETLPLENLHTVFAFSPSQKRFDELEDRVHPAVPSWVHWFLILSAVLGWFLIGTSWFLYRKIWLKPKREKTKYWVTYTALCVLHALAFVVLYLPLLGFVSPVYLIVKWGYWLIRLLFIKPFSWLFYQITR